MKTASMVAVTHFFPCKGGGSCAAGAVTTSGWRDAMVVDETQIGN